MKKFIVTSPHGEIEVQQDGTIIKVTENEPNDPESYLKEIGKFDVERYKVINGLSTMPERIDILRIGFWDKLGNYDQPLPIYEAHRENEYYEEN